MKGIVKGAMLESVVCPFFLSVVILIFNDMMLHFLPILKPILSVALLLVASQMILTMNAPRKEHKDNELGD